MSSHSVDNAVTDAINEIYRHILDGDIVTASMLAQEILSDLTAQWHRITTDGSGGMQVPADSLLLASTAYAETLLKQQQLKAAYSAAMTGLAYTVRVDAVNPSSRMMALLTAWEAVEQLLTSSVPSDAAQQQSVATVAQGIATLLYRQYYLAGKDNPDNPALVDAYQALQVLKSLVDINPSPADPVRLLGEVLNASQHAGLIE